MRALQTQQVGGAGDVALGLIESLRRLLRYSHFGKMGAVEIAGEQRAAEFARRSPAIRNALHRWLKAVEEADWKNPAEMKRTFGSADIVGAQTVFNIGGNKCRLIALIHYGARRVLIQHVLTHQQYDKGDWKQ